MSWRSGFPPAAALAVGVLIGVPFALGQEPSGPPPQDTIFARKILMGAIDMNMDAIETMLAPNGKFDAAEAQEHADTISIMLMSFPHMFLAATNQWKAGADRDPATDTYASPTSGRILRISIGAPRPPPSSPRTRAPPSAWTSSKG